MQQCLCDQFRLERHRVLVLRHREPASAYYESSLSVSHAGLTVITPGHWNGIATLSRIASGKRAVIAPREAITFRVDAANGTRAIWRTEFDGFGQALYQLQIGAQTALDLMTGFGFKKATTAIEVSAKLARIANCASALENPTDGGALIKKCFNVKNTVEVFGTHALLIAPIMVASTFNEFSRSEFNALGDQLNQRDTYTIQITTAPPPTTTTTTTTPVDAALFVGSWQTHAGVININSSGAVTITWFLNDPFQDPPASGDVVIGLQITSTSGRTATARVLSRTDPPAIDPTVGPGAGPDLHVGRYLRADAGRTGRSGRLGHNSIPVVRQRALPCGG